MQQRRYRRRKFTVEIEGQIREETTPEDLVQVLHLDLYFMVRPGTKPIVAAKEEAHGNPIDAQADILIFPPEE